MTAARRSRRSPPRPTPPPAPTADARYRLWLRSILFAYILVFPWAYDRPLLTYPLMGQFFFLGLGVTLLLPVLAYGFWKGHLTLPASRKWWLLAPYLLTFLIATVFSILPTRSLWGAYEFMGDGLTYLVFTLMLVASVAATRPTRADLAPFIALLLAQGSLLSLQIWGEIIGAHGLSVMVRPYSPLLDSNYFISYALLLLPVAFLLAIAAWRQRKRRSAVLFATAFGLMLTALFFCLPSDIQGLVTPWRHAPYVTAALPSTSKEAGAFLVNPSNTERFTEWSVGLSVGKAHPLTGSGPGTLRAEFYTLTPKLPGWNYLVAMDLPHNDLIQQYAGLGVPGLLAYLLLWIGVLWSAWRSWRTTPADYRPYVAGLAVGLTAFLAFNVFSFTVVFTGLLVYTVAFVLGIFGGWFEYRQPPVLQKRLALIGIALLVPLCFWSLRYFAAELHATAARRAGTDYARARAESEAAAELFPAEENYASLAAGYSFNQYVVEKLNTGRDDAYLAGLANNYAAAAVQRNPYLTRNKLIAAAIQYITAPAGSAQESQAFPALIAAVHASPWDFTYYHFALGILQLRASEPATAGRVDTLNQTVKPFMHIELP